MRRRSTSNSKFSRGPAEARSREALGHSNSNRKRLQNSSISVSVKPTRCLDSCVDEPGLSASASNLKRTAGAPSKEGSPETLVRTPSSLASTGRCHVAESRYSVEANWSSLAAKSNSSIRVLRRLVEKSSKDNGSDDIKLDLSCMRRCPKI